ncbi:nicotinate (nicotinamide) nucleotide adenylyltransferase [Kordiimonas aquimaris]|uniref:nicotinate (nicotinamide) nucleotide adenylyltransferase n=1 Tax=Kordiimonas aquimaris TaxID=707591 RepID=UPI0021D268AC|nr:nicotinate (nicotinamide) nucleotide adenylyltransferase [Kordiimonas aquimaris]
MPTSVNINTLMPLAARWQGRTIGLYGGSFNPAHQGHVHVANEAVKRLKLDMMWLMVSPGNPLKEKQGMAKRKKRKKSLKALIGNHPRMLVTDIEKRLGTRNTYDTLKKLTAAMPKTRFVWIMGADNLATFHHWYKWQSIAQIVPIAIFDRPGYSVTGLSSRFANNMARFRVPYQRLSLVDAPAWSFVTIPRHNGSATEIRDQKGNKWWR